ncbi:MAG: phosphoglucosamine mutase [Candidatus Entotheonella factor]|uniref:Phosphoglucosamine mutase n=1 Tax=Entotheonella factor TaxID=1429438 RepID=W4LPZ4_ENTF1|nr:MAG: phosphoglucosamine mutase [Candidatus Entotheonella factor]
MTRLFGTDGIRGLANVDPVSPEVALSLGRAAVEVLAPEDRKPLVVVGRDTRLSGSMLEGALVAGLCAAGADVLSAGVLPTAGVAYLTRTLNAMAGVMISASHNSFEDNGIKFFSASGHKLEDAQEDAIADILSAAPSEGAPVTGSRVGQCVDAGDAAQRYTDFLASTFTGTPSKNVRIGLDCAHGAAATVAPELFRQLGAHVSVCHADPDGKNINQDCGSLHPERLQQMVVDEALDLGFAFDGDADRLVAVDHTGTILDGDYILAISAQDLRTRGALARNIVVSTVMANLGLDKALRAMDIELHKTKVGDKYVMQDMREHGAILGGEQSGHILYLDHHTTGDGLLTAVQLLNAVLAHRVPLQELAQILQKFPQVLINVRLRHRCDPLQFDTVRKAVQSGESALDEDGRILVRLSGTEPVARVMVEGPTQEVIEPIAACIAQAITDAMGEA